MVYEEARIFGFIIRDDIKVFGVFCAHWKFLGIGDDFVFDKTISAIDSYL